MRNRLRARIGRDARGNPQAHGGRHDRQGADVVAVLTGNVLKDPDYIYRYHTNDLKAPDGSAIRANFGNQPIVVPNDEEKIAAMLSA